jgi:hypothetical protein
VPSPRAFKDDRPAFPPVAPDSDPMVRPLKRLADESNLVIAAGFDPGRSRLANSPMGLDLLPTGRRLPAKIITLVLHADDRPPGCRAPVEE